jgi:uncharacterized delta-60 repeat protein
MKNILTIVLFTNLGMNIFAQQCSPIDPSFGTGGKAITNISTYNTHTIVQTDGKIIQAGSSYFGNKVAIFLLRLNFNGSPDPSFGNAGKIIIQSNLYSDQIADIALQTDGKIVIAGTRSDDLGNSDFFLLRFNDNGSADQSFGINGVKIIAFSTGLDYSQAIAIQADGKILVSGISYNQVDLCQISSFSYPSIAIVRVNINGSIDSSFGQNGKIIFNTVNYQEYSLGIDVQSNRKILVTSSLGYECSCQAGYYGGLEWICNKNVIVLKRLNEDGTPDISFGLNGQIRDSIFNGGNVKVIVQPDDKIVLASSNYSSDFLVNRYESEGVPDIGFGQGGKIITKIENKDFPYAFFNAAHIQPDGKILLLGNTVDNDGRVESVTVRYKSNGDLDSSFYLNGMAFFKIDAGLSSELSNSLASQGNMIIVGGVTSANSSIIAIRFLEKSNVFEPDVIAAGPLSICSGDSVNLSTTFTGNFQWYKNNDILPGATNPYIKAIGEGNYRLMVDNSIGCGISAPVFVAVRTRPQGVIINWNGIQLSSDSTYTKYQWYLNGAPISGGNSFVYTPGSNLGTYKVEVTNSVNCSNFSNEFNYILTGVADLFLGDTKMRYYPNPAQSKLNIDIEKHTGKTIGGELYEMSGKIIFNQSLRQGHNEFSLSGLRPGVYSLVIRVGTETAVRKLIIVK